MAGRVSWHVPENSWCSWSNWGAEISHPEQQANTATWTQDDDFESGGHEVNRRPGPYIRGSYLGAGSFGTAYKVKRKIDGKLFAGKCSTRMTELRGEAKALESLDHDHILKLIDWYEDEVDCTGTLVTELCAGGNLQTQINEYSETIGRKEALQVVVQIGSALDYVHGRGMMHSDLKPKNIFIRSWNPVDVVLADCADIRSVAEMCKGRFRGTPVYQAPDALEIRRNRGVTDDIWALGITFLALLGQWPLRNTERDVMDFARLCSDHAMALRDLNPNNGMVNLLARMLEWHPDDRASAAECVRLAQNCLEESGDKADNEFGINSPEGFRRRTFW